MLANAASAYAATSRVTDSPRSVEEKLFARSIRLLSKARQDGAKRFAAVAEAVHFNNRLWTAVSMDLASKGNDLPEELKASLISLAGYSVREGDAILRREGDIDALIDVNRTVMAGLRGKTPADLENT